MQLEGATLKDRDLRAIGTVVRVFLDPASLDARWLQIRTDGGTTVLVPAPTASEYESGELLVPYPRELIESAPGPDPDRAELAAGDAARLRRHYGFPS